MLFGNGLLVSEGDFWRRQRKLAQPAFHRERITAYGKIMTDCAGEMLRNWKDGETRDVHAEMMRLTLEIVTRTLFSAGAGDAEAEKVERALHDAQESVMKRMRQPIKFPDYIPTAANRQLGRAVRVMDGIIYEIIRERRKSGAHPGDLLDLLLQVRDEDDGTGMSDKQLRDEALTVYLAGTRNYRPRPDLRFLPARKKSRRRPKTYSGTRRGSFRAPAGTRRPRATAIRRMGSSGSHAPVSAGVGRCSKRH